MKRFSFYLTASLLLASLWSREASAQAVSNAKQRHDDKKGMAAAAAGVADDRRDVDRLSDLIMRWDYLMKQGRDGAALQRVDEQIAIELRNDLRETAVQARQADKEVKQSTAEVVGSRREVRREAHDGDHNKKALRDDKRDLRDDRRDLRDDRRDRRDDKRDAKKIEEILARKREISKELIVLQKRIDADKASDPVLQAKKRELYGQYVALSREEIELGIREEAEDLRELREDRRETREDRRQ